MALGATTVSGHPLDGHGKRFGIRDRYVTWGMWSCHLDQQRRPGHNRGDAVLNDALVNAVVVLTEVLDGQLAVVFARPLTWKWLTVNLEIDQECL